MSNKDEGAYHNITTPPTVKPSGCPIDHEFTTFDNDYLVNPYPELKRIREKHPIFYSEKLKILVFTRMEDVTNVLRDHDVYSSANVQDPVFPICDRAAAVLAAEDFNPVAVMSNRQQPDHTRIRKYTREGFSGRRMKILEPYIRRRSHELVDAMIAKGGPTDFVRAFGHPLKYREVESIIYGHSFAGHEIVSNFMSNALLCLLPRRDDWQAIVQDTSLIPNALEEVLRFDSPQTSWRRVTNVDTTIEGIDIPAGTQVFLSLGAANHQPSLFESPASFDIKRANARKHVSFGHGIHFCLGARLARLEATIALETLAERLPGLRLVENAQPEYSANITFRGPKELFVEWD